MFKPPSVKAGRYDESKHRRQRSGPHGGEFSSTPGARGKPKTDIRSNPLLESIFAAPAEHKPAAQHADIRHNPALDALFGDKPAPKPSAPPATPTAGKPARFKPGSPQAQDAASRAAYRQSHGSSSEPPSWREALPKLGAQPPPLPKRPPPLPHERTQHAAMNAFREYKAAVGTNDAGPIKAAREKVRTALIEHEREGHAHIDRLISHRYGAEGAATGKRVGDKMKAAFSAKIDRLYRRVMGRDKPPPLPKRRGALDWLPTVKLKGVCNAAEKGKQQGDDQ